ncbi:MAG: S8 family peptidase, partial [Gammaproteobacteria bacterium]
MLEDNCAVRQTSNIRYAVWIALAAALILAGCQSSPVVSAPPPAPNFPDAGPVYRIGPDPFPAVAFQAGLSNGATSFAVSGVSDPACLGSPNTAQDLDETHADYSKSLINIGLAYDIGLSGNCVTVAVIDSGLSIPAHIDLPRERVFAPDGDYREIVNEAIHGSAVAGTVAGAKNGIGSHGVAFNATVHFFSNQDLNGSDGLTGLFTGALNQSDSKIYNMSWALGATSLESVDSEGNGFDESTVRELLGTVIDVWAQSDVHPDDRALFVWAAGNQNTTGAIKAGAVPSSPAILSALAVRIEELLGHWITVVAVGEDGLLTGFSNRCGLAAAFCLAAPGEDILTPTPILDEEGNFVEDYFLPVLGTSFAAPIVAGALALMEEQFRGQLGSTALASRLFATANKSGVYADTIIYGQGLLDVERAITPVGSVVLTPESASASGSGPISFSAIRSPVGSGSDFLYGLYQAVSDTEVMLTDALGAPFWKQFGALPGARPAQLSTPARLSHELVQQTSQVSVIPGVAVGSPFTQLRSSRSTLQGGYEWGYALDSRRSHSRRSPSGNGLSNLQSGYFISFGMAPELLLSLCPMSQCSRHLAGPEHQLAAQQVFGLGVGASLGSGLLSAAWFVNPDDGADSSHPLHFAQAQQANELLGGPELLVVQYQSASNRLSWSADVGMLNEPHSWQGLSSFNSPYGDFKSQMDYVGVKGIWCLDAAVMHCQMGTSSWNLGAAFSWSQLDLDQKQSVLLQDIQGLEEYQVKLSLMGQSLWHAQDWLQLSVGWQMTLGE